MEQSTSITPTARWFYAFEDGWQAFNDEDDGKLEQRWKTLREQGKLKSRQNDGQGDVRDDEQGEGKEEEKRSALSWPPSGVDSIRSALFGTDKSGEEAKKSIENAREKAKPKEAGTQKKGDDGRKIAGFHLDPDESAEERATKVEVMEDHLFDVDLESMEVSETRMAKGTSVLTARPHSFFPYSGKVSCSESCAPIGFTCQAMAALPPSRTMKDCHPIWITHTTPLNLGTRLRKQRGRTTTERLLMERSKMPKQLRPMILARYPACPTMVGYALKVLGRGEYLREI